MIATPWGAPPWRVDLIALARWNTANQRARDEYRAHPIISAPYCEHCHRLSARRICDGCAA